ncbi:MAG: TRAP transporter permease [Minwuiales bacterium]|nr:TRAP transporter permease [Minwuiales bacterium]
MSETTQRIEYEETKTFSLLEHGLRERGLNLAKTVAIVCSVLSVALALFHLYVAAFGTPESRSFRSTHLTVMLVLAILLNPLFRRSMHDPLTVAGDPGNWKRVLGFGADLVLVGLGLFVQVYTLHDVQAFLERQGDISGMDVVVGTIMVLLVLEATRRTVGVAMVLITAFFIVHTLYTPHFFGIFYGPPTSFQKYIDLIFMRTEGIFGIPIFVASTYILLFILFGAVLLRSGAGRFFIDLAISLTGHRIGGPAKASVVASAFMGTVSGSAVANVVTTGSFTIPLMKRLGYRPKFSGAVEACASSGGQITPPIMGAAAFIIAEFLHVSYLWVVVAAVIPTFLYFATMYFMVHLEAEKHGIEKVPKERLPRFGEVMRQGWHLLLSLAVLVALLVVGYTPMLSAFWAIITLIALSFISKSTRMSAADLLAAFETGVRSTVPVTIACACAGIIIGSVFTSGLGLKFTYSVIDLAGGQLLVLLVLTALAGILLGMGMTTTAVYITVAALIVPALVEIGVTPMAAHLFAFYFGVVSSITPPVALASFAAAAIAGSPPMATAVESARIGIAKYLVPFAFVYNPSLLFEGPVWLTAYSATAVLIGVWALSVGLEGWYRGAVRASTRIVMLALAALMFFPPTGWFFGLPGHALVLTGGALIGGFYLLRGRAAAREQAVRT